MTASRSFTQFALRSALMLAPLLLAVPSLRSAEAPVITISKSDTMAVAVTPLTGPDGAAATKVLLNDLALSGYFHISPPGSAGFLITGASSGGSLEGSVTDHSGKTVAAKTYSGSARGKVHQFADDIVETLTGNPGIAGSRVAFVATRSGHKEIFTADSDGANVQQLTHDSTISVGPKLSADGRILLYTGYKSGYPDVYEIDLGSGSRNRIIHFSGTNTGAVLSPDGHRIAVTLSPDGNQDLYVTSAGGSNPHRLTHTPGVESSPTWSPNGDSIIYSSDDGGSPQLYEISAGGGSPRHLSTGYGYCTEPNWSPDGKKVAFNVRDGGSFAVAVLDLQTNATRLLVSGDAENPAWGPDSRHLIFAQGGALILIDAQTSRRNKLLDGLGKISEPTWSR